MFSPCKSLELRGGLFGGGDISVPIKLLRNYTLMANEAN